MKIDPEHGQFGDFRRRHEESALEHILHDARGFQADRLAARVGPRNDEDMLATVQLHVERHDLAALRRSVCCSKGWRAFFSISRSSVETIGFTQPFSEAQRPLARSMSISAR